MLQSSSGRKWKKCETMLLFYSHTLLRIHVIGGQRSVRIVPPSLPPHHSGPATRDFQSSISVESTLPQVSSGCARPPSPTTPVLCHGPVRLSPPSGSGGGAPTCVPLQLTSPSSPSRRHLGVPSASSPVSVWSLRCRLGWTLRSMLTKVKDTLPLGKQSNVVISYPLQLWPSLHRRDQTETGDEAEGTPRCLREGDDGGKSAVAEHTWEHHHPIHWEETTVLDHGRGQLLKEALHIQMTPVEERFNRDGGLEIPGCWTAVMRRQGGRSNPHRPLTSNDVYPQ